MFNDVKVVGVNFVFLKVLPSFGYVLLEVLCEGGVAKVAYLEVMGDIKVVVLLVMSLRYSPDLPYFSPFEPLR